MVTALAACEILHTSAVASSSTVSMAPPCAVVQKPLPIDASSLNRTAPTSRPPPPLSLLLRRATERHHAGEVSAGGPMVTATLCWRSDAVYDGRSQRCHPCLTSLPALTEDFAPGPRH